MDISTFLRTYKARAKNLHWFLGAGASVNAGIMSAWEMTWEFKRDIYCSENGKSIESCRDLKNPRIRNLIQSYLDSKNIHPAEDSLDEYSHYFKLAYRSETDRRNFIDQKIGEASIKFSHKMLAALLASGFCKVIWTTNFDSVIEESWQSLGMPIGRLNTASIENSLKASQCLRDDRFPLYVKLHGDFQSTTLKNTTEELKDQDPDFKNALLNLVGSKYGFVCVGYSGRDNSVMDILEALIEKADSDYPGLFWFNRIGTQPIPRVQLLIEKAVSKGIDAHVIDIPSFDELMLQVYKFMGSALSDFSDYLQPTLDRKSPAKLSFSNKKTDVIRLNAFKVISTPHIVYQFESDIGGIKEVKVAMQSVKNVLATRVKEGVLAFGDRDEIASVFNVKDKASIVPQPFKLKGYKSSELFLLYQVLEKSFTSNLPLKSYQGRNGLTLYIDPDISDLSKLTHLHRAIIANKETIASLRGKTPGLENYWSESVKIRLEEYLGSLWLFVTPSIFIADSHVDWANSNYILQEDFRKKRRGDRYNKQFNEIFEGWCISLGLSRKVSGANVMRLFAFTQDLGVNPALEVSTISSFSRGM